MNNDRSQKINGSMAESPKGCGGVVMKRESMMKKSMNSLLRVALVGVMALVFGLAGFVSNAEAVLVEYWTDQDTGTNVATGITTNFGDCAVDPVMGTVTLALKDTVGSCAGRWDVTTEGVMGEIYYNTAYATETTITGQATGNLWYLRERSSNGTATFTIEVFYVLANGTEVSLGSGSFVQSSNTSTDEEIDLSGVSGSAPAGSKLGYRLSWTSGGSTNVRAYFGPGNGVGGADVGYITVDEVAGAACAATAPSDLGGSAASSTQVDLTWTYDGTNNDYYTVFRDTVQIATNVVSGSYSDTTAAQNTTYDYTVRGYNTTDTCESADSNTFNVTTPACTETATLTLTPISDPITGDVNVVATGTATGISVGTSPAVGNASGWTYSPAQDDNTTIVSFYAEGTGVCGTMTDSQLNVATDTMVAPTVVNFTIPVTVTDTAAPLEIPITTFTAIDNVAVTGYMITESVTPPLAGDAGWLGSAPATYTVPAYGPYTLYAWAKDAAGNVSISANASTTISNCVEVGTVTVSISPDPDPADITGAVTVNANLADGATNGQVRWRQDGGGWTAWVPSGATYTPSADTFGTIDFEAMADGSCGAGSPVYSATLNRTYDVRVDALEPVSQSAVQSGLTAITATMIYCNDKNGTGQFQVDYRVSPAGAWNNGTPVTDGGAGDQDGTKNEQVVIILSGLVSGTTYDVRLTYIDATDGVIGTAVYTITVPLVAWVDNAMLHNSNRFPGTVKHGGDWGTTTGYAGGIMCSTCHEKNPANSNIKRIKASISFPDSSTMPGGGTSAAVTFSSAVDGTSDFGDDSAAPRASSNRVCEVCHNFDGTADVAARISGTLVHAADQNVVSNHYDNADCMKCHEHKGGFKASCDSCHASPPINNATDLVKDGSSPGDATGSVTVGKHVKHANDLSFACNTCHTGWENAGEMPKGGQINVGFVTSGSNGGTYNGRTGGGGYLAEAGTTVNTNDALTCAVYCHGYGSPQWADAGTAVCGACHGQTGSAYGDNRDAAPDGSAGLGGRDLSSLLTGFKVGKHANHLDNSIDETGDPCALCHFGTLYPDTTHVDGTVDVQLRQAAVTGDNSTGGAGVSAIFTPGGPGTCSSMECHADADWDSAATGGCTMCHDYPPNAGGNHAAGVNPVNHDMFSASGVVDNHDSCTYCHGYKGVTDVLTPLTVVEITALKGDTSIQPFLAGYHNDGLVTMNDDLNATAGDDSGYNATNAGCDTAACHANDASHRFNGGASTGNSIQQTDIGPGSCATCHDTGSGSAPVVTSGSSHVKVTAAGSYGDCTDCHSGHYAAAGGVQIVNNAAVGISYTQPGHGGIKLGGPGTNALISGKTTEAEICWACHTADGISEFGLNTDTNGTSANYNYGTLSANAVSAGGWYSNVGVGTEAGATWTSAVGEFLYKEGAIQSTHTANDAGTSATTGNNYAKSESLDAVADIRCSYCHDVHDLNRLASDTSSGKPWLRGTWNGNPYKEDGAPRDGMSGWTNTAREHNDVPRASASAANRLGGFWIDQNTTTNPAAQGWTANSSSGLCAVCHGSDGNATWTTTEIGNIDVAGENNWVSGQNGHANVVINGGGRGADASPESYARNIFTRARRGSDWLFNAQENKDNPFVDMGVSTENDRGFSFRGTHGDSLTLLPSVRISNDRPYTFDGFEWNDTQGSINIVSGTMGLDVANAGLGNDPQAGDPGYYDALSCADPSINSGADDCTEPANYDAQANYHKFNCGKCHNPHASRLPKLMITNCLDTRLSDWDEINTSQYTDGLMTDATAGETTAWHETYATQWPSAQNCHRLDNRANASQTTTRGTGWNTVTPW